MGKKASTLFKLKVNDIKIIDKSKIAKEFSLFFDSKITSLTVSSHPVNLPNADPSANLHAQSDYFSLDEIVKAIGSLKMKKSQGVDEVPTCVIKDLKSVVAQPYTWLFNVILDTGKIPKAWKISRIVPIHKKGNV